MNILMTLKLRWRTTCLILLLAIVYINVVIFMLWQSREWAPEGDGAMSRSAACAPLDARPSCYGRWCQTV